MHPTPMFSHGTWDTYLPVPNKNLRFSEWSGQL
jgi:hypothetical protein